MKNQLQYFRSLSPSGSLIPSQRGDCQQLHFFDSPVNQYGIPLGSSRIARKIKPAIVREIARICLCLIWLILKVQLWWKYLHSSKIVQGVHKSFVSGANNRSFWETLHITQDCYQRARWTQLRSYFSNRSLLGSIISRTCFHVRGSHIRRLKYEYNLGDFLFDPKNARGGIRTHEPLRDGISYK